MNYFQLNVKLNLLEVSDFKILVLIQFFIGDNDWLLVCQLLWHLQLLVGPEKKLNEKFYLNFNTLFLRPFKFYPSQMKRVNEQSKQM